MSTPTKLIIGNYYCCEIPDKEFWSIQRTRSNPFGSRQVFVCKLLSISGDDANITIPNDIECKLPIAWLSEIEKALPVGIESYLTPDPARTDLFQYQEQHHSFPCCACIHVTGPAEHCQRCTHYAR